MSEQKERPTFSDHNICLIYIVHSLRDILVIMEVLPVTKHVRKTQKHLDTILVPRDWLSLRMSKVKYSYWAHPTEIPSCLVPMMAQNWGGFQLSGWVAPLIHVWDLLGIYSESPKVKEVSIIVWTLSAGAYFKTHTLASLWSKVISQGWGRPVCEVALPSGWELGGE